MNTKPVKIDETELNTNVDFTIELECSETQKLRVLRWKLPQLRGWAVILGCNSKFPKSATSSSPVQLKTRHVGARCTLNLSRAQTSSRRCGVVVRRGGASSDVVHVTLPWFKITWSVAKSPLASEQCDADVYIHSLTPHPLTKSPGKPWETPTTYTSTGLVWPLCGHARMDDDHLLQCTGLDEYPTDNVVSRYWEARCQMVKKPSTGVG
ncbi:uncharacterized protein TNCV_2750841 [Trichonephila clavipes]|nr:uncharacterized protein TNCV_2750841 [Trichonephila clavipes]